ncbi:30S ribosomal protein S12 methylthiotransferase RimO [Thiotrichales bacterium 19S9-12]|nr:30S ribosomal protein S12 methylthiotransferase RimO [Thiotrichales bacterium 19S9-11]MCF6811685.1 30S ribosomal protein S12 methylthiotransferase RimO [Thiotrichales bacterium 19S9-12]
MQKSVPRVGFVSLGCPKNLVDSERIITQLRVDGYEISNSYDQADLVVVNTCGFINEAVKESLDTIGEALRENGKVLVTGCLGSRDNTILENYPNVLGISGAHAYQEVVESVRKFLPIERRDFESLIPDEGIKLTPRHYAYLKISEGCNNSCTFCIIPDMRGKLDSRPLNDVMYEAERLAKAGVKELLVISQDTSAYGVDLKYQAVQWRKQAYQTRLLDLAKALGELGIWVRFHYVYPYPHVDKIIPLMAEGKILPYLDIPFQHANMRILKLMKRPANSVNTLKRIQAWRSIAPELTIRSTFIVGFPGETEAEFNELLDFLYEAQLDRVGCFAYSDVDGAGANHLEGHLSEEVKEERLNRFHQVQAEISAEKLRKKVGTTQQIIIDEVNQKEGVIIGRTKADAPEVDGIVAVNLDPKVTLYPGMFANVKITETDDYDLGGELII